MYGHLTCIQNSRIKTPINKNIAFNFNQIVNAMLFNFITAVWNFSHGLTDVEK